jgi:hypothetical protein
LFAGNTSSGTSEKGYKFHVYNAPDGTMIGEPQAREIPCPKIPGPGKLPMMASSAGNGKSGVMEIGFVIPWI